MIALAEGGGARSPQPVSVSVCGVELVSTDGLEVDLSSLIQHVPQLADDWRELRDLDACHIRRFC